MLIRVTLVRTDVSEELSASFIRVTRIGELRTTLAITSNRRTLLRNTKSIPKPQILHIYSSLKLIIVAAVGGQGGRNIDSECMRAGS
jgi:hypothetical protein